ncbi:MAG: phosphoribosylformylglycinamidine synthase I [Ignavibacteria bacterium RIFCSPHIGHO2_02_FULL_56_12]|nr:MAG: phosphoribosylformylglycinamidine synthase I [Ignavibacteria bacterium RIFCSPHIGHO2_02_FULL_56_12]
MKKVRFGIVVFPGSNCDHDAHYTAGAIMGQEARFIWHKEGSLGDVDVVILPGGFSYGDYLRCGAIARFSPIMKDVVQFAERGGPVIGICNGFQVLTEAGLLPGVLLRNASLRFICKYVHLRVERNDLLWTNRCTAGEVIEVPIAHGDGNYFGEPDVIRRLEEGGQLVFRYCEPDGRLTESANPNGAVNNIAGIVNERGNVLGLMPHPERAADEALRHVDGRKVFDSIVAHFVAQQTSAALATAERS